jgi:methyl-accepting chemotaxis protein
LVQKEKINKVTKVNDLKLMGIFKRILTGLVIFVNTIGLIFCLAGIIGVWVINTPLTKSITSVLEQTDALLTFSLDRLDLVANELNTAQDLLANLEETVVAVGQNLTENSPTLTFLSNTVGKELKPKLETTAEVISTVRGTIISVNNTLETANSIPFVSVPTLPMEQFDEIDQQMQEIVGTVKTLGEAIRDFETGMVERTSDMIMVPVDKLTNLIERVLIPVIVFSTTLRQVQAQVNNVNTRIPALIDWGSVLATFTLVWLGLGQASLLYGGWYYWKTGTLPTIRNHSIQISQEAQNETDSSDTY